MRIYLQFCAMFLYMLEEMEVHGFYFKDKTYTPSISK